MKKILTALILFCCIRNSLGQAIADSGVFLLHKFEQNIGKEKYTVTNNGGIINYAVDFKYIDRGSPVHLTAAIRFNKALEPLSFRVNGGTSRFSSVNDSVVITGKTASVKVDDSLFTKTLQPNSFPIAGYSPAIAQMLLVQYWKNTANPSYTYAALRNVSINKDGNDTLTFNDKR